MKALLIGMLILGGQLHAAKAEKPAPRPNILVILADDLGYGDVRAYNPTRGKIPTPHLDKLAAEGMRFTDGHSSSGVCSPSRYALLTGRYHWRTRLQAGIVGVFGEPLIAPDRLTVAGLAKQHGYRTAAIGKWHLGWDWPISQNDRKLFGGRREADTSPASEVHRAAWTKVFSQPIPGGPTSRGFDAYFGTDAPLLLHRERPHGRHAERVPAQRVFPQSPRQPPRPRPARLETRTDPAGAHRARVPVHHGVIRPQGTVPPVSAPDHAAHAAGGERGVEG